MFEELVISGGGTNYIAMLGALHYLFEKQSFQDIRRYIGTSIGAVLSLLLAIGYTPNIIYDISLRYNFSSLNEIKSDDVLSIFDNLGITTGEKLLKILIIFLKYKNISPDITFEQLFILFQKELVVIAWCVDDQKTVAFSKDTFPHLNILTAIHMSIAVPFIFKPVAYDDKLYIDGGIYDNLPVDFVNEPEKTVCITTESIKMNKKNMDLIEYFHLIMRSVVGEMTNLKLKNKNVRNVISIKIPYSPIINTELNESKKQYLFELGNAQAKKILDKSNDEN
jgi:predicted acylesterase/phospholipase RssA